ncbi:MAG: AsnC family transcriptional regulator [Lachnospiraceae bacterium]|nr:AsnC family transcriptional regulator [Lachnospiraceae bacterium]
MDKTDELILDLLKGNARMSFEELGQAIGMSRVGAKKRVAKLEKEGIIRGYNTCIYREGEVTLYIELVTKPDKFEDVLRFLANHTAYIRQIFKTSKENHIQIVAVSTDVEGLNYLLNTIRKVCDKDITELHFHTVKDVIKDVYGGIDKYNERKSVSVDSGSDGAVTGCEREEETRGQIQVHDVPDEGTV